MKKRNFLVVAGMLILIGGVTGCTNKNKELISYMEDRYGKDFTYVQEKNSATGRKDEYTIELKSEEYPGSKIFASWTKIDGKKSYSDNYMAVVYREDTQEKIEEVIKKVFKDYRFIFPESEILLSIEDLSSYTLQSYLADPLAYKNVYILTSENLDKSKFQLLMNAFSTANISVKGLVAVPTNMEMARNISEEDIDSFLANDERVKSQVNFNLENQKLIYETWR